MSNSNNFNNKNIKDFKQFTYESPKGVNAKKIIVSVERINPLTYYIALLSVYYSVSLKKTQPLKSITKFLTYY